MICRYHIPKDPQELVIVGSGLAGLHLARELHQLGVDGVWIAEAGADFGHQHINSIQSVDNAVSVWQNPQTDPSFYRNYGTDASPHFGTKSGIRRRVGGRSLYWHGVLLPMEAYALNNQEWPSEVVGDLTHSFLGGPSLYDRQFAEMDSWRGFKSEQVPVVDRSIEFFRSIGYPMAMEAPQMVRSSLGDQSQWEAYSPLNQWSKGSDDVGEPTISYSTEIQKILHRNYVVEGVQVRDPVSNVTDIVGARNVVLAAGTMQNSALFLNLVADISDKPQVRLSGLFDHLVQGFVLGVPRKTWPVGETCEHWRAFLMIPGTTKSRSNTFIEISNRSSDMVMLDVWAMGEQVRSQGNSVNLDSSTRNLSVRLSLSPQDFEVLRYQHSTLSELYRRIAASLRLKSGRKLPALNFMQPQRLYSDLMADMSALVTTDSSPVPYVCPLGTVDHEGGTIPIGTLLDTNCQSMFMRGLYVLGPSSFPRPGAANPSLTTLSLAKRLAIHLSALLKGSN